MYWLRQYTGPLMLALGLHVIAAWALYSGWSPEPKQINMVRPQAVMANLLVLEPKARPAPAPVAQPAVQPAPAPKPKPVAPPKADPAVAERKKAQALAEKQARERAERLAEQERERLARQQRLNELAQSSLEQAISTESANLQAGTADMVAQSYQLGIYDLVRQNWSRPPSARNGMSARLLVELIPTGEVVAVSVVESSGNTAFDRSAEQAVRRARRFEVPQDNAIFEENFRQFYFLFQPEDLLR
ncbi:MAG: cell envelope integrity protein TolA [bacterium]